MKDVSKEKQDKMNVIWKLHNKMANTVKLDFPKYYTIHQKF